MTDLYLVPSRSFETPCLGLSHTLCSVSCFKQCYLSRLSVAEKDPPCNARQPASRCGFSPRHAAITWALLTVHLSPVTQCLRSKAVTRFTPNSSPHFVQDWLHDEDPIQPMKHESPLAQLKAQLAARGTELFTDLIRTYFLENTHRLLPQQHHHCPMHAVLPYQQAVAIPTICTAMLKPQSPFVLLCPG